MCCRSGWYPIPLFDDAGLFGLRLSDEHATAPLSSSVRLTNGPDGQWFSCVRPSYNNLIFLILTSARMFSYMHRLFHLSTSRDSHIILVGVRAPNLFSLPRSRGTTTTVLTRQISQHELCEYRPFCIPFISCYTYSRNNKETLL